MHILEKDRDKTGGKTRERRWVDQCDILTPERVEACRSANVDDERRSSFFLAHHRADCPVRKEDYNNVLALLT